MPKQQFSIDHIPMDDKKTFTMLGEMRTVGVFQFESAGMRDIMGKLKPDQFEDLIAINALYRPGPMDDIPKYIARKLGHEPMEYLHPLLKPILESTYGVMVYQEQVMRIAQDLAGYTLGAADLLRRAMGKKIKSEMDVQRQLFVDGCLQRTDIDVAITAPIANQIFDAMAKFAGYGFNKSHSAPYALIAYQTAYLKANYSLEFFASLLTHDAHNQDKLAIYFEEMKSMAIALLPPCVNNSKAIFTIEGQAVRFGLAGIKNVGMGVCEAIAVLQPFKNVADFFTRVNPQVFNKRQAEFLIQAGAFDVLEPSRHALYASLDMLLKLGVKKSKQRTLFEHKEAIIALENVEPWDLFDQLNREKEAIGFYLSQHPLDPYHPFVHFHNLEASTAGNHRFVGMIRQKNERISKNGNKFAYVTLTTRDRAVDLLMFAEQLEAFKNACVLDEIVYVECYEKEGQQGDKKMIVRQMIRLEEKLSTFPIRVEIDFEKDNDLILALRSRPQNGKQTIRFSGQYRGQTLNLEIHNIDLDLQTRILLYKAFYERKRVVA
ncbi:MAG: DNA polymerase III subunit alpha [Pseudomonadota bacterium]